MLTKARLRLRAPIKPRHIHGRQHIRAITSTATQSATQEKAATPSDPTLAHLRIDSKTRVIFQGFTGSQATVNAQESIAWGTNIVGGVTKGREGEHLGLPLLPTVRRAVEELKPDATGIYVPAKFAIAAIEEAIEAEIPLIVAVAEHIPLHDMLRVHQMLRTQGKSRLVGPNSPGIISATEGERCRIGFQPLPCFSAGCVGIAAKSGTLSYEAVASTTRAGLGQSLCIGVGGDVLPGTDLVEALSVLEKDPHTKAIALIGEVGGEGEVLVADWVKAYNARTPEDQRKPMVALIAGAKSPLGKVMGHAGAFWVPGEPTVPEKIKAFKALGVRIAKHPAEIGNILRKQLDSHGLRTPAAHSDGKNPRQQRIRSLHTSSKAIPGSVNARRATQPSQTRRYLHLDRSASKHLLEMMGASDLVQFDQHSHSSLVITMDRSTRTPCILLSPRVLTFQRPRSLNAYTKIPLPADALGLFHEDSSHDLKRIVEATACNLELSPPSERPQDRQWMIENLHLLLRELVTIFVTKEAKAVSLCFGITKDGPSKRQSFHAYDFHIELDDAVYRIGRRHEKIHSTFSQAIFQARTDEEIYDAAASAEASKLGMTYHRLEPRNPRHNIGTLVNGAGLAMNTVDALADAGGLAANFLDTGGLATSETVSAALELILRDKRVKVMFVNIFGGLTKGDMIARGVISAFKALELKVPVVVRIRGTNEAEGQQIIAESGLPLFAFDDFNEAAEKAVELAAAAEAAETEKITTGEGTTEEAKAEEGNK